MMTPKTLSPVIEREIAVRTQAGETETFICHPAQGAPRPVVVFLMDAPGIREELRNMVRRLANSGYYVLLPNLYYRSGVLELGAVPVRSEDAAFQRMVGLMRTLTVPMVMDDFEALLDFAAQQPEARSERIGCVGYCMSGQYAINAAARFPDRVAAAASIYGTRLVTDLPDSPHRVARAAKAELYFGCAQIDPWASQEAIGVLREALARDRVRATVEVYANVEHGFAFPERPAYDREAAEKHWERLRSLFDRCLHR
jgi:carboxymethylenebutenolidase